MLLVILLSDIDHKVRFHWTLIEILWGISPVSSNQYNFHRKRYDPVPGVTMHRTGCRNRACQEVTQKPLK